MKPLKDKKSIVREILEACYGHGWLQAGINVVKNCKERTIKCDKNEYTVSNFTPSLTGKSRKYFCYLKNHEKKPCMGSFKCFTKTEKAYNPMISDFADAAAAICPEEFSGIGFGRQFYGAMGEGSGFEEQFKNYMELMNWCRNYRDELVAQGLLCPDDEQYFFRALSWIFHDEFPYNDWDKKLKNICKNDKPIVNYKENETHYKYDIYGAYSSYDAEMEFKNKIYVFKCRDAKPYVHIVKNEVNQRLVDYNNLGSNTNPPKRSPFLLLDVNWYPMALYWLSCEKDKNSKKRTYLTFDSRDYAIAINVFYQISLYILENFDVSKMTTNGSKVTLKLRDFSAIHERIKDFSQEARLSPADYAEKILFPTWCNDKNLAYYPILEQDSFKPLALKVNGKNENEYKRPDFMIYCKDNTQNKAIFVDVKTVKIQKCSNPKDLWYLNNVEHKSYSIYDPMYFACYKNENQKNGPFGSAISVKDYQQKLLDKECPVFLEPSFVKLGNCCEKQYVAFEGFTQAENKPFDYCEQGFEKTDCQDTGAKKEKSTN